MKYDGENVLVKTKFSLPFSFLEMSHGKIMPHHPDNVYTSIRSNPVVGRLLLLTKKTNRTKSSRFAHNY